VIDAHRRHGRRDEAARRIEKAADARVHAFFEHLLGGMHPIPRKYARCDLRVVLETGCKGLRGYPAALLEVGRYAQVDERDQRSCGDTFLLTGHLAGALRHKAQDILRVRPLVTFGVGGLGIAQLGADRRAHQAALDAILE
jgi:hypothetical protein